MKKIFDSIDVNNITVFLKDQVSKQISSELRTAKSELQGSELLKEIADIEEDCQLSMSKVTCITGLNNLNIKLQKRFFEMMTYINESSIEDDIKLRMLLTYGSIISKKDADFSTIDNEKSFLMTAAVLPIPLKNYDIYSEVLFNSIILDMIFDKTTNINDQLDICEILLDCCENTASTEMCDKSREKLLKDCSNLINGYTLKKTNKLK